MVKKVIVNDEQLIRLYESGKTDPVISEVLGVGERTIRTHLNRLRREGKIEYRKDLAILQENVQLAKEKQKLLDKARIENTSFRNNARIENAIEELQKEILDVLKKKAIPKKNFKYKKLKPSKSVGAIIHLSDLHFNELIDLPFNKYDFKIASQRLRKYVIESKKYLKAQGVKDICICFTGDLMNSDRRLDEVLSEATNRAKALVLSLTLLEQVLIDYEKDFNVSLASVIGNESRITKDIGWTEEVASDNYDYILYEMLKKIFVKSNMTFFDGSVTEKIVEIVGQNVLLIHGNQCKPTSMEKEIQKIKGKWNAQGVHIDFVISGHYHSSRIGDVFARCASLAGANAYSNDGLQLESRASQNMHIFYSNGDRDSIKIDLQNPNIEGYLIDEKLEAYNAKSVNKAKKKVIVHKVVL